MSIYEFFKDFAGPISTGIAAIAAATVTGLFAYRQSRTAELQARIALEKLKYDTFERRHDVLDACRDMVELFANSKPKVIIETQDIANCASRMAEGRFYFGKHVNDAIVEYTKSAADLAGKHFILQRMPANAEEKAAQQREFDKDFVALRKMLLAVHKILEFDLSLNLLKEGSEREGARKALADSKESSN